MYLVLIKVSQIESVPLLALLQETGQRFSTKLRDSAWKQHEEEGINGYENWIWILGTMGSKEISEYLMKESLQILEGELISEAQQWLETIQELQTALQCSSQS